MGKVKVYKLNFIKELYEITSTLNLYSILKIKVFKKNMILS
jgi:hypothetical protein